jgi:hypothetical protein
MMDERQIREEAWLEGAYAVTGLSPATAFTVPNPYAPDYTPSLQEMNAVLLSKFSQVEIWRGEKQRDNKLAQHVRVMVVEELQQLRSVDVDPLVVQTINHCVGMIKRMKG